MNHPEFTGSGGEASGEINLAHLLHVVWDHRHLFLSVTAACVALAIVYALLSTKIYRSEVLASYNSEDPQGDFLARAGALGGLASLAGLGGAGDNDVQVAIAILESKQFVLKFIDDKKLMPVLFADDWDAAQKRWNVEDPSDAPTKIDAYDLFDDEILGVFLDQKTALITIGVEWEDPKIAADWANELVKQLNEQMRAKKVAESQRNLDYLNRELATVTVAEVRNSIFELMEEEIKAAMISRNREEFIFKVIDPAMAAQRPIRPRLLLLIVAGGLIGGMLGLGAVFIRHRSRALAA